MKIVQKKIKVKEVFDGYVNNDEEGIVAYKGKLNVRPPYQREFVYNDKQRNEVINTIYKNYPLNVMYWCKTDSNRFELLDGQQRTLSFCMYLHNDFSVSNKFFNNLTKTEKDTILNYELTIYICEGNDLEKLSWFKIINIAGEELTHQELLNAIYSGPWILDAKKYFSKNGCVAYQIGNKYLNGSPIRQDYLEKAIKWISNFEGNDDYENYIAIHQHQSDAKKLWKYFNDVIDWIGSTFTKYRSEMKGLEWGLIYNKYHNNPNLAKKEELNKKIDDLMEDEEIQNKKGIYEYVFDNDEKHLNLRSFSNREKRIMYERQKGICPICHSKKLEKEHWDLEEMEADHIIPWSQGGKTNLENGQMLCRRHNREKSNH